MAQINYYHVQQFGKWIEKLKSIKEGDSTLLDNSMIVYGAGLSDGNRHTHEDLPTLIAGRGGNYIKSGRRIVCRRETPMCNLFLTMMDRMGAPTDYFGDATGPLRGWISGKGYFVLCLLVGARQVHGHASRRVSTRHARVRTPQHLLA
jgi:hypothetical protein